MRVTFGSSGNFNNITKWLESVKTSDALYAVINRIADEGTSDLKAATPIGRTGKTAAGWEAVIDRTKNGVELSYVNNAHVEDGINVAKIIQLGHGTGNGGYVAPINYIPPAMDRVMAKVSEAIEKEITK